MSNLWLLLIIVVVYEEGGGGGGWCVGGISFELQII